MTEKHWTRESLRARLRAQSSIDAAPVALAERASKRIELLTITDQLKAGAITPEEATARLERIPTELRAAS
jgi:hypothetical protein